MASITDGSKQSKRDNFGNTGSRGRPEQGTEGESVMYLRLWPTTHSIY